MPDGRSAWQTELYHRHSFFGLGLSLRNAGPDADSWGPRGARRKQCSLFDEPRELSLVGPWTRSMCMVC